MARLQLSERELHVLRAGLSSVLDGTCVPEWELEALLGCSRSRAKRSLDAGLRRLAERGERPLEPTCERMVLLLSVLLGADLGPAAELECLIAKLGPQDRSPRESGIALRRDVVVTAQAQRR